MDNTKYVKNIEYTVKYSKNKNSIKKESDEEKEENPYANKENNRQ